MIWQYCFGLSALVLLLPAERKVCSFYLLPWDFFFPTDDIIIRVMLTYIYIFDVVIQNLYYRPISMAAFQFCRNRTSYLSPAFCILLFHTVQTGSDKYFYVRIMIIVMQLHNTNAAAACVEHLSTQATGRYVYTNISIAAVVHLPKIISVAVLHGHKYTYKMYFFPVLFATFTMSLILINLTEIAFIPLSVAYTSALNGHPKPSCRKCLMVFGVNIQRTGAFFF